MINNNILVVDVVIAVVIAVIVLIISPGIAVTGLLALLVLAVIAVSFAWTARRRRPGATADRAAPLRRRHR